MDTVGVPVSDTLRLEAARAGVSPAEYQARMDRGELFCYRCADWHPETAFPADRRRHTGRGSSCAKSILAAIRDSAAPDAPPQIWVVRRPAGGDNWQWWRGHGGPGAWSAGGLVARFGDAQEAAEALIREFGGAAKVPEGCRMVRLT